MFLWAGWDKEKLLAIGDYERGGTDIKESRKLRTYVTGKQKHNTRERNEISCMGEGDMRKSRGEGGVKGNTKNKGIQYGYFMMKPNICVLI